MTSITRDGTVEFRFFRPHAHHVFIVGDFNGWRGDDWPMHNENGTWIARAKLPPGSYQFRYLVDGQWFTDYAANGVQHNGFGAMNSILEIPKIRTIKCEHCGKDMHLHNELPHGLI